MSNSRDIDVNLLGDISSMEGSLAQRVYLNVRAAILSLDFPPGAIIRRAPICEKLGVSLAPVSEAIIRLSSDGLVDVVPQSGTHVSYFSMSEIREGTFIRQALELATVAKVTRDLTDDQRVLLRRNIRMQELLIEDEDVTGFYKADEEFHKLLMSFTGFQRVSDVARAVSLQVSRARLLLLPTAGRMVETLDEHRAVCDAVLAGNAEAAQEAMRRHLDQLLPRIEPLQRERPQLFGATTAQNET